MKKKSALGLAMTGGLPWAGVAPLIEAMRQIGMDKALPQMPGCGLPAPETAPLAGQREVNHHVLRAYVQNVKVENRVTLDIDAHLMETDKAEAHYCYGGHKAFQPI